MSAFEDLGVHPEIIRAIEELEWILPTAIQSEAIPLILGGGDVLAAAETGSGKTGAFALPLLQITHETVFGKAIIPTDIPDSLITDSKDSGSEGVKWDDTDRDVDMAVDGFICQSRSPNWAGIKANQGVLGSTGGKYYYEATVRDEGLCRVGWALKKSSRNIGTDKFSFGYGGTGKRSSENKFLDYGLPYGTNDTIGCYLNLDEGIIGFSKNGQDFGQAFQFKVDPKAVYYPALVMKNAEMVFNFGSQPFKHQLKDYLPLNQASKLTSKSEDSDQAVQNNKESQQPNKKQQTKKVNNNNNNNNNNDSNNNNNKSIPNRVPTPISLIIEPVKELADQTYSAILNFSKYLTEPSSITCSLCIGGTKSDEVNSDIIVGTPGRLEMLVKDNKIDLSKIRFFVLDEADQLIQDNLAIINFIYNKLPKTSLQVLFFSATLHSPQVVKFCEQITRNPTWVDLKGRDYIPDLITHAYVSVEPMKYNELWRGESTTVRIKTDGVHANDIKALPAKLKTDEQKSESIKLAKPHLLLKCIEAFNMDQAIIFARTRLDCDNLASFLIEAGGGRTALENKYSCSVLHGDKLVQVRKENFDKFKAGEVKFLICTDVAARGIDIRELPYVINYTLPDSFEDYVHRVGRVGRADRIGLAISLVGNSQEKVWYHTCRDKGKGCHNTKLLEEKGCCVWYDEPELFTKIQETLSPQILNDDFKLPDFDPKSTVFGKLAKDKNNNNLEYKPHTEELRSRVLELSKLEESIQIDFLTLPNKIANKK